MVGFNCKDKTVLDKKYICSQCHLIYRQSVQFITCGHRYCKSCVPSISSGSTINCPQCHQHVTEHEIHDDIGFAKDLEKLPITCFSCLWEGFLRDYAIHLDQCHPILICEHCNEPFETVQNLTSHQKSECQYIPVSCPLKNCGCSQQMVRGQLEEHYHTRQHNQSMMAEVNQIKRRSSDSIAGMESVIDSSDLDLQSLSDVTGLIIDALKILGDDSQHLSEESDRSERILKDFSTRNIQQKWSVEEINSFTEGLKLNFNALAQETVAVNENVGYKECTSYDGNFIWKITGVREKMLDAQSERQTSVYSLPFYSSPTGYKMKARAYLNGDGHARRTHMSLFFVSMRSAYDATLKFPFDYKVTFCLYDQTSNQHHIIDSFRPDVRSNSFQRPKSDMNIASGIPKFVPLQMIQREDSPYVRDDTMFIKIMVDFLNTPKTVLPFILNLDPGLPIHIQQTRIKEELERREQQQHSEIAKA